ncbi:Gfo/Idh/MocA family protein [Caproiciproducens sp.]|uniref:Gfo/Idh/MocA family protein n=1 Tax=Caproiciproducens sp. TaxID=1954376 RepID=UPI0028996908|nr:Gfo/Idh/MocA family oxidoreductase [Caproiciproducens sp.]
MIPLKIALIGFGNFVRNAYLPSLEYDGRAVVTSVAAPSEKTRQDAVKILGSDVAVFENGMDLLANTKPDAVMIAVPDPLHRQTLETVLKSGIPVFYEPPVAERREEISEIVEQLLHARQITHANLELGYHAAVRRVAAMVKEGTIGSLQNVTVDLQANWGGENPGLDTCLINRASCWYVNLLNCLIGSSPKRVLVLDGYGLNGRRQNVSTGIFDYNGVWGFLKMNVHSAEKLALHVNLVGSSGVIDLDYFTGQISLKTLGNPNIKTEFCPALQPHADWPGVRESVSAFLDAVLSGEASQTDAITVAELNKIGMSAEKSKDTDGWAMID